jgi:DUF4097 and DUF4098 domain-containing protein YvlB
MPSWEITEPRKLDFDEDIGHLDVSLFLGRLNVVGTDGPARVEVAATGERRLTVTLDAGRLSVRQDPPVLWPGPLMPLWWWLRGRSMPGVDVSIAVPYRTPAALQMSSGPVVVSGLRDGLTVSCTSGRVALLGVAGRVTAAVVSGTIEALGCAGDLKLDTVSGEVTVADSAVRRLRASTVSGALTADLDNPPHDSELVLDTTSGELTIRVREDSDLTVDLVAAHGRVTSAFPGLSAGGRFGAAARGVLGAGTGRLSANAISGNIALLSRPVDPSFGDPA